MDIAEIQMRLGEIREVAHDDAGVAHGLEDQLHQDVLRAIARQNIHEPHELARWALRTKNITFERWSA